MTKGDMDGRGAIEFHRAWLLRLLTALFAEVGMEAGGAPLATLSKPLRRVVLRFLLPAESATKRLILFLSRRMVLPPKKERSSPKRKGAPGPARKKSGMVAPSFWLFDKRKCFAELSDPKRKLRTGPGPRIIDIYSFTPDHAPDTPPKSTRDPDDALRLSRRMLALYRALQDLDGQALRLLRIMAKRDEAPPGRGRYGPMRPGLPPGYRKARTEDVDHILYECHMMAWFNRPPPLAPS